MVQKHIRILQHDWKLSETENKKIVVDGAPEIKQISRYKLSIYTNIFTSLYSFDQSLLPRL